MIPIAHYSWYLTLITFAENKLHLKSIVLNISFMKKFLYFSVILLVFGFLNSCSKDDSDNNSNTPGPKFTAVKSLITSSCATSGCHTASAAAGGVSFESDANIVAAANRINVRAVVEGTMPPSGPLSSENKAKITDWINAGGRITD